MASEVVDAIYFLRMEQVMVPGAYGVVSLVY